MTFSRDSWGDSRFSANFNDFGPLNDADFGPLPGGDDDTNTYFGGSHISGDRIDSPSVFRFKSRLATPVAGAFFAIMEEQDITQKQADSPKKRGKKRSRLSLDPEIEIAPEAIARQLQDYNDLVGDTEADLQGRGQQETLDYFFALPIPLRDNELSSMWKANSGMESASVPRKKHRKTPLDMIEAGTTATGLHGL